jgi:hypothetical protein
MSPSLPPVGFPVDIVLAPNPFELVAILKIPATDEILVPSVCTVATLMTPLVINTLVPSGLTLPSILVVATGAALCA